MRNATLDRIRQHFPTSLLVFKPRRELTIGDRIAIAEKVGMHLEVHVSVNRPAPSTAAPPLNGAN